MCPCLLLLLSTLACLTTSTMAGHTHVPAVTVPPSSALRAGTISWKPLGGGRVDFFGKLGFAYGSGPGCNGNIIGQYLDALSLGSWACLEGCGSSAVSIVNVGYYCVAANEKREYEAGQKHFEYVFSGVGPFIVGFESSPFIALSSGHGSGPFRISTTVDLRERNDTGNINSSPSSITRSILWAQAGCDYVLRIPVIDPDDDTVKCRWAEGSECQSICKALPGATLNETTCTITVSISVQNSYSIGDYYAVAVTIEDFPRSTIQLDGGDIKTAQDPLSGVALQFVVIVTDYITVCQDKPYFSDPTPSEGSTVLVYTGDALAVETVAYNEITTTTDIESIEILGPTALIQSSLSEHPTRAHHFKKDLFWSTTEADAGEHLVCISATNTLGKSSDTRCFKIRIVIDDCLNAPCQNGGTCFDMDNGYICTCLPGYTGQNCSFGVDFCHPENPCGNRGTCENGFSGAICQCENGWGGPTCGVRSVDYQASAHASQDSCSPDALQYGDCSCFISPNPRNGDENARTVRDIVVGLAGGFFGLMLSFVSFIMFSKYLSPLLNVANLQEPYITTKQVLSRPGSVAGYRG